MVLPSGFTSRIASIETADGVVDEADGFVPDGMAVSVFDAEIPAVGRLDPDLLDALRRTATDAEADGVGLRVNSGWRSPEYQKQLLDDAVVEHGSQEEAARWVATVETSAHVPGDAVDIGPVAPLLLIPYFVAVTVDTMGWRRIFTEMGHDLRLRRLLGVRFATEAGDTAKADRAMAPIAALSRGEATRSRVSGLSP